MNQHCGASLTCAIRESLGFGLAGLLSFGVVLAGSLTSAPPPNCDDRWSPFGIHMAMTRLDVRAKFPAGEFRSDERGRPYYFAELSHPFEQLDVRKARLSFWFDDRDVLEFITVSLRGRATYRDVVEHFEQVLGKPNMVTSSTYGTWWGGLRSQGGRGWNRGCGVAIRVERGRFGEAGLEMARADNSVP